MNSNYRANGGGSAYVSDPDDINGYVSGSGGSGGGGCQNGYFTDGASNGGSTNGGYWGGGIGQGHTTKDFGEESGSYNAGGGGGEGMDGGSGRITGAGTSLKGEGGGGYGGGAGAAGDNDGQWISGGDGVVMVRGYKYGESKDETVFLLHLDNDSKDSINGIDITTGSLSGLRISRWEGYYDTYNFNTVAKFGQGGYVGGSQPTYDISNLNLSNQFTIDFWYSVLNDPNEDWSCVFSTSQRYNSLIFRYWGSRYGCNLTIGNLWYNQSPPWVSYNFKTNQPTHVAITRDGFNYKLFLNGNLVTSEYSEIEIGLDELSFGDIGNKDPDSNGTINQSYPSYGIIDEFRISNVVRWTSNFTPPTAPY